jgi:hypothetical protein
VPDAVVLSATSYQKLLDEIARLRDQGRLKKAVAPSRCQLKGKIEGRAAALQAQFDFVTERPDTAVTLACGQAFLGNATLDGHTPVFRPEVDSFTVQVDKPGEHQVILDLMVPLSERGPAVRPARDGGPGWQGLELALPRAAVTTIEMDLPGGTREVHVGGKPWSDTLVTFKSNHLGGGLGPTDKLDLTWKVPTAGAATLLAADGRIRVRLDAGGLTITAELTLRAESGQASEWRLLAPRGAVVRAAPTDEGRLNGSVEVADQPNSPLARYTLRLNEPSAEPLRVVITTRSPILRPGNTVAVGPFALEGASRQSGLLLISNTLPDLHLDCRPHGDLVYKQLSIDDERRTDPSLVTAFRYNSASPAGQGPGFELEAEAHRSHVKTTVRHVLSLRPEGTTGALRWYAITTIFATPRWTEVDQVKVLLPPNWEPLDDTPVPTDRLLTLKVQRAGSSDTPRPVTLNLEGRYADRLASSGSSSLALPHPVGVFDQGGEVTVQVPRDQEVSLSGDQASGLESVRQTPHEQTWRGRPLPESLSIRWRPYAPDVRASAVIDLRLTAKGGEVWRHEIRCQLPQPTPPQLALRVPPGVTDLRLLSGGTLSSDSHAIKLPAEASREHSLVLSYSFASATKGASFVVPLVTLAQATQADARVRVWCESGMLPVPAGPTWDLLPIEEVADHKALPVLVLRTPRAESPLTMHWAEAPRAFDVLIDRAVIQVEVEDGGGQRFRARYRLRQLASNQIDVELPLPVSLVDLKATLGSKVVGFESLDEAGHPSATGRTARLRLGPDLVTPRSVLALSYVLPPGRAGSGVTNLLNTPLVPPVVRGDPGAVPVCWQVTVPSSWVVLGPESGPGAERAWARRGWLLAPRLTRSAAEVAEEGFREPGQDNEPLPNGAAPAVVCWRTGAEPLTLTHVPQLAWWLACSPVLLVVGLTLYGLGGTRGSRGRSLGLALLAVAVGAGAILRPAVLSAVAYGCEPGAGVLLVVLLMQWLVHERYRRQVVFLPSFSRGRAGSSLIRGSSAPRSAPGEPSTVDVPRPAGSSAAK